MKRVCTICARGGSKGVPNKNILEIAGRPLIAHSLEQAEASGLFDSIAVSSDSNEILDVAAKWGADHLIKRPDELASDTSAKLPAIRHCVLAVEEVSGEKYDIIVDLDATSPLRSVGDVIGAVELLEKEGLGNVITGTPSRRSPYFNLVEKDPEEGIRPVKKLDKPVARRQDAPECFDMNASIYVWRRSVLLEKETIFNKDTALFIMPEERSIDMDSIFDLEIISFLIEKSAERGAER
ncbi:MAG: acylneuraminate cytidylyltransferase family protein [Candidatus Omnitrophica bacterium]|nr:acylneuraminate cytidylyltransferase family protein [Candidatus Omnitrophota bacterium]MBU1128589.1 acylneuraminate cytidylyltransferase family protein [Candidatus Omnitrophota bacterium]MBU1784716.1 acylneuraminate cytidylyltransferase family protein [Candidatus Omnitrophota bacterium]MBU1851561.1 acylneuraminate cytidylyltransferase family protein [Candidatus Omnitrophota bacterium]